MNLVRLLYLGIVIVSASTLMTGCKFRSVEKDKPVAKKAVPRPPVEVEKEDVQERGEEEKQGDQKTQALENHESKSDCVVTNDKGECVETKVTVTPAPVITPRKKSEDPSPKVPVKSQDEIEFEKRRAAFEKKVKDGESKVNELKADVEAREERKTQRRYKSPQRGQGFDWMKWQRKCEKQGMQPDPQKVREQGCQSKEQAIGECGEGLVKHPKNKHQCVSKARAEQIRQQLEMKSEKNEKKAVKKEVSITFQQALKELVKVSSNEMSLQQLQQQRGLKLLTRSKGCVSAKSQIRSFQQRAMGSRDQVRHFQQQVNQKQEGALLGVDVHIANVAVAPTDKNEELGIELLEQKDDFQMCDSIAEVKLMVKTSSADTVSGVRWLSFVGYIETSFSKTTGSSYILKPVEGDQSNTAIVTCLNSKCETMVVLLNRAAAAGTSSDKAIVSLHAFSHQGARQGFLKAIPVQAPVAVYPSGVVEETHFDTGLNDIEKGDFADMLSKVKLQPIRSKMTLKSGGIINTNLKSFDVNVQYAVAMGLETEDEKLVEDVSMVLDALQENLAHQSLGVVDVMLGQRAPVYKFQDKNQSVNITLRIQCANLCDEVMATLDVDRPLTKSGVTEREKTRTQYKFHLNSEGSEYELEGVRQ